MYKYTRDKVVLTRINGKNIVLGADYHENEKSAPQLPTVYNKADQKDLKALYDLGFKWVEKVQDEKPKTEKPKQKKANVDKAQKSDSGNDTGLSEGNDNA